MIRKLKYRDETEWKAIRGQYIGGSDAGAVVGMNSYKGPLDLWMEKTGRGKPFDGNIATETGHLLEPFVAELFTRETGKRVRRDNHTMVNDLYPFACANVDRRIVGEDALLECKTTSSLPYMRRFKAGEFPETWYCQCVHYMAVTGAQRVYLAVLISCREFMHFIIERDEEEIEALMGAEARFWECVKSDTPPQPSAVDDVAAAYPAERAGDDAVTDLTAEADLLKEYEAAEAESRLAEERLTEIKKRLCAALGESSRGAYGGYRVEWSAYGRSTFDIDRFKKEHPQIDFKPYYTVKMSRRFKFGKEK